jgi:PKD domain
VGGAVRIENQPAEFVKVIKLIDRNVSPQAPRVTAQVPSGANAGEMIQLSAQTDSAGLPGVEYHGDLGDGASANGPKVSYAYTRAAHFTARLRVDGVDGVPAVLSFPVTVTGIWRAFPKLTDNRRFQESTDP